MDNEKTDIRWKQRFAHYKKAFTLLEQTIAIKDPSDAERAGLIQFFEMSFELAWKVLKDFLEEEGFTVVSRRGRRIVWLYHSQNIWRYLHSMMKSWLGA